MLGLVIRHLWAVFGPASEEEEGQALTEYGLILALIAIAAIGALVLIGTAVAGVLDDIGNCLQDPTTCV
ncbi:MAG TPA: Flp family type IVb pilin [Dehalococcoidia bacterium]|nr:Flp family type IVb pilin [Dehalococcoidia bacterium]